MYMTRCQSCTKQLEFRTIYRSFLAGYAPISCPNCNAEYVHRPINRAMTAGVIGGVSMLFFVLNQSFLAGVSLVWQAVAFLWGGFLISLGLVPFLRFERRESSDIPQ